MQLLSKKISNEMLEDLLDKFTRKVANKQYKRIPYVEWQQLKNIAKKNTTIDIRFIFGDKPHVDCGTLQFSLNDKSFGEFLLNTFLSEDQIMTIQQANSISADKVSTSAVSSSNIYNGVYYDSYGTTLNSPHYYSNWDGKIAEIELALDDLSCQLSQKEDKKITKNSKTEENVKMIKFDFGPCNNNSVKMSMLRYGSKECGRQLGIL